MLETVHRGPQVETTTHYLYSYHDVAVLILGLQLRITFLLDQRDNNEKCPSLFSRALGDILLVLYNQPSNTPSGS